LVRIHQVKHFFQRLSDQFIERYVALGYKWVTKDYRLMVNQALIGALRHYDVCGSTYYDKVYK